MREKLVILSHLLDKYEKSQHLFEPGTSTRRVMLRVEKKEFPEYLYEDSGIRDAYNRAAAELEQKGLVAIEWVKGRPVLSTVILNLNAVAECYRLTERIHPRELAERVKAMVSTQLSGVTVDWIASWRDDVCREAEERLKIPAFCKKDLSFLAHLTEAFAEYDKLNGEPITMRAFSNKCYHDTKYFEGEIRETFLRLARQYDANLGETCEQEELGVRDQLAYLGIYARPELYELCGPCVIRTHRGLLDAAAVIPYGLAIPSTAVDGILSLDLAQVRKVTFIENKTNYDAYLMSERQEDELVLYHGGFLSPQKKKLFAKVKEAIPSEAKVFFWADIDLGGFQMFHCLQQIIPKLCPMRMSEKEMDEFRQSGLVRPDGYLEKVRRVLEADRFPLFRSALDCILKYGVTIEQEAML